MSPRSHPTCHTCGAPLQIEYEIDAGICLDCAYDAAPAPTPDRIDLRTCTGLHPVFEILKDVFGRETA